MKSLKRNGCSSCEVITQGEEFRSPAGASWGYSTYLNSHYALGLFGYGATAREIYMPRVGNESAAYVPDALDASDSSGVLFREGDAVLNIAVNGTRNNVRTAVALGRIVDRRIWSLEVHAPSRHRLRHR